jgi:hypothetical protein
MSGGDHPTARCRDGRQAGSPVAADARNDDSQRGALRCGDRSVRYGDHSGRRRSQRRATAEVRAVHAGPPRAELSGPKRERRADHSEQHQHPVAGVYSSPASMQESVATSHQLSRVLGEPKAPTVRAGPMHASPRHFRFIGPDHYPAASEQRERAGWQRLVSRPRNRPGAAIAGIQTSRGHVWAGGSMTVRAGFDQPRPGRADEP